MSEADRQLSIGQATNDRPTTGVEIEGRTHYAHVRYAATEQAGVIWFDPRDGQEYLALDVDTSLDALELDEKVLTSVRLHGHRNRCGVVDPSEKWVLERNYAFKEEFQPVNDVDEMDEHVGHSCDTEIYEDQEAARDAAAELVDAYADAEWRDAVEYRTGGDDA